MNETNTQPESSNTFGLTKKRSVEPWVLGVTTFLMTLMVHMSNC